MAKQQSEIWTISEYLKVAERLLYRLAASKRIPTFKIGGAWRFAKSDIERRIREQTVASRNDNRQIGQGQYK
ncbi:MAG TPA: helix-turn-helix domain-containing protein [Methylococcus sp.]|nr:helix-turn-helix domain-containing protein [Methylococcus sp.]